MAGSERSSAAIAARIEASIREGALAPGSRLAPIRDLARRSGVSVATAARAYRLLARRGWISTDGRRGTRVSPAPASLRRSPSPVPSGIRDLSDGNPDRALLPQLGPALSRLRLQPRLYGEPLKSPRLVPLARKRFERDGIDSAHLAVTSGALDGIERVLSARLRPGDRVLVEDPGFSGVIELVRTLGMQPVPLRIDQEGPYPGALREALGPPRSDGAARVQALVVTPRAQNPTGVVITSRRRRQLTHLLARHPGLLLIEDDHAADVAGARALTLVRPSAKRWAVVRSVSKSLGPDLRLAVVAGDEETIAAVEERQTAAIGWVSHLLQELVAELWSSREVIVGLRKAEDTYRRRRETLLAALQRRGIRGRGASGLNVWVRVSVESAVVEKLRAAGWAVAAGERFRLRSGPAIRVTASTLAERQAERFAGALRGALSFGGASRSA